MGREIFWCCTRFKKDMFSDHSVAITELYQTNTCASGQLSKPVLTATIKNTPSSAR